MEVVVVVDRIEGDFAVVEIGGEQVDWPLAALPPGTVEGSRVRFTLALEGGGEASIAEGQARLDRLRAAGPQSDDIEL